MSLAKVIVLDLDGTLLDTSARHYGVYSLIARSFQVQELSYSAYIELRRTGMNNLDVLTECGLRLEDREFAKSTWLKHIETLAMLKLDRLFPGVPEWLGSHENCIEFVLVTLRSNAQALRAQLVWLDLLRYFQQVLDVPHQTDPVGAKAMAVGKNVQAHIVAWIGDSEIDIRAARQIGVEAIGVTSGMRTAEALLRAGAHETHSLVTDIRRWQE
jgi:phosphoglycolate phosphatase-like HAD superfamily hydrolase